MISFLLWFLSGGAWDSSQRPKCLKEFFRKTLKRHGWLVYAQRVIPLCSKTRAKLT